MQNVKEFMKLFSLNRTREGTCFSQLFIRVAPNFALKIMKGGRIVFDSNSPPSIIVNVDAS
jgi:hypothetical protein